MKFVLLRSERSSRRNCHSCIWPPATALFTVTVISLVLFATPDNLTSSNASAVGSFVGAVVGIVGNVVGNVIGNIVGTVVCGAVGGGNFIGDMVGGGRVFSVVVTIVGGEVVVSSETFSVEVIGSRRGEQFVGGEGNSSFGDSSTGGEVLGDTEYE